MKNQDYRKPTVSDRIVIFIVLTLIEIPVSLIGFTGIITIIFHKFINKYPIADLLIGPPCIVIANLIFYFLILKIFKIRSHIEISAKLLLIALFLIFSSLTYPSVTVWNEWSKKLLRNFGTYYLISFFGFVIVMLIMRLVKWIKEKNYNR